MIDRPLNFNFVAIAGKYLLKSTISVRCNDAGDWKLLRGDEKASADHESPGKGGGKGAITQVDENAVLTRAYT